MFCAKLINVKDLIRNYLFIHHIVLVAYVVLGVKVANHSRVQIEKHLQDQNLYS